MFLRTIDTYSGHVGLDQVRKLKCMQLHSRKAETYYKFTEIGFRFNAMSRSSVRFFLARVNNIIEEVDVVIPHVRICVGSPR